MAEFVQVESVNVNEMRQALTEAPTLCFQFVRRELRAGGNRFRKRTIAERMSGRPGIKWTGRIKVGKNIKIWTTGDTLGTLKLIAKGSGLLGVHEYGATIRPTKGEFLFLRGRVTAGRSTNRIQRAGRIRAGFQVRHTFMVFARTRQVTIPPRLGFKVLFNQMTPEILGKAQEELTRGIRVAFERRVKAVASAIQKAVA